MPQQSTRQAPGAAEWVPESADLETLRAAAQKCRGCELFKDTTQVVLGEGALDARPQVVVPLGATAGRMLLGSSYRVTKQRGERLELDDGTPVVGTIHPSSVPRTEDRKSPYAAFVRDLGMVASMVE